MEQEGFENADVVFITDGVCALPDAFREELAKEQTARRFTVSGVLLDQGSPRHGLQPAGLLPESLPHIGTGGR